jgi:acetamidase/formamidase
MCSGETITIDVLSHEGILEDPGPDPLAWLKNKGCGEKRHLERCDLRGSALRLHHAALRHRRTPVITGPVAVRGAKPGDVLEFNPST